MHATQRKGTAAAAEAADERTHHIRQGLVTGMAASCPGLGAVFDGKIDRARDAPRSVLAPVPASAPSETGLGSGASAVEGYSDDTMSSNS